MWIKALYLKNFRIYPEAQFRFCPQINLITGPNARGKTTILEAIHLLITGRSFRTVNIKDLIREGEQGFYIELRFEKQGVEQSLKYIFDGKERSVYYNHSVCANLVDLLGLLQGSFLLPDDIQLIKGAPKLRRRFLDLQIAQISPLYVHHLTRYYRAMKQRNTMLKQRTIHAIEVFEHEMAKAGSFIIETREQTVQNLVLDCQAVQHTLSEGRESVALQYKSKCSPVSLIDQFNKMRYKELMLGTTLVGPHKDDFSVLLGNREAKLFASEGQKKSLAIAFRFAEWKQIKLLSDSTPLMLIDDVGDSLDAERRKRLFLLFDIFDQVFVTSTESLDFPSPGRQINSITIEH